MSSQLTVQDYLDKGYELDDIGAIRNLGFMDGVQHSKPSPETIHLIGDLKEALDEILVQTKTTNGKVAELSAWKLRYEGGAAVLKGIWGFVAVYVVSASGALLMMWADFRSIPVTIRQIAQEEIAAAKNNLK